MHSVQTQLKRTTANLICIVCHALWLRDWDICHRSSPFSLFSNIDSKVFNMYCHPLTSQWCVLSFFPSLRFLLLLVSIHFVSSQILSTKEAIFGSCVGFLIHHFVVIASSFSTIIFFCCRCFILADTLFDHKAIRSVFVDNIYLWFFWEKIPDFFSLLVPHFNFFSPKMNNIFCLWLFVENVEKKNHFLGFFKRNISASDQSYRVFFRFVWHSKNYRALFAWTFSIHCIHVQPKFAVAIYNWSDDEFSLQCNIFHAIYNAHHLLNSMNLVHWIK